MKAIFYLLTIVSAMTLISCTQQKNAQQPEGLIYLLWIPLQLPAKVSINMPRADGSANPIPDDMHATVRSTSCAGEPATIQSLIEALGSEEHPQDRMLSGRSLSYGNRQCPAQ